MHRLLIAGLVSGVLTLGAAHDAAAQRAPKGATARCEDGTYSKAQSERGACSAHGGVAKWYGSRAKETTRDAKIEKKTTKAERKADRKETNAERRETRGTSGSSFPWPWRTNDRSEPRTTSRPVGSPRNATAQCNDGTYSYAEHHQGACSGHDGVKVWYR